MNNTLGGVLRTTMSVLKKTFWKVGGIYLSIYLVSFICGLIVALLFGRDLAVMQQITPGMMGPVLPKFIFFILLCLVLGFLMFLVSFWIVLIIRNNVLIGKNLFKEAFSEAFRKIWKILGFGIITGVFFLFVLIVLSLLLGKSAIWFLMLLIIFIGPLLFSTNYGLLCKEGDFIELISEGISLGIHNWFRIFGYYILVFIFLFVTMIGLLLVSFGLQLINLGIVAKIIMYVWQMVFSLFVTYFYTVFYLDLAGIKPQEAIDLTKQVPEPVLEQPVESKIISPAEKRDDNEPPHMDILK